MNPGRLRVLLVVPHAEDAAAVGDILRTSEHVEGIHVARDAEEAVAYLSGADAFAERARFPLPHLVLLDLRLPGMSALGFLEWMKARTELRRIPLVVLSGSRSHPDVWKAYDLGANSYLLKPPAAEELLQLAQGIHAYWSVLNAPPRGS